MQKHDCYKATDVTLSLQYLLYIPENFDKNEKLPLIVFLHGAGERGADITKVKSHGPAKMFDKDLPYKCLVLSPQCPEGYVWNNITRELIELIKHTAAEYNINLKKITITGLSMGGYGTWEMGMSYPDYFAALAPICGGGMAWRAGSLKNIPIRAFHGDADKTVSPERSIEMVNAVNSSGGKAELTLYPGVGHDSWVNAYEKSDLLEWLLKQEKD